jgi:TRAP-type C4-dicarboxylate transport system substrate-binding protein
MKTILTAATMAIALASAAPACAQTKLKCAHVYETTEPSDTEPVWAADEFKKRTDGKNIRPTSFPPRGSAQKQTSIRV